MAPERLPELLGYRGEFVAHPVGYVTDSQCDRHARSHAFREGRPLWAG